MADEMMVREAKAVYESLKKYFDHIGMKYQVQAEEPEEQYVIQFGMKGYDIPMEFHIFIHVDPGIIRVISPQPVKFEAEKRLEAALAICKINNKIIDGAYSMDLETGMVLYTQTTCFMGSLLSDEVFAYLLGMSGSIVDHFNDKLLMLQTGMIDLEGFIHGM